MRGERGCLLDTTLVDNTSAADCPTPTRLVLLWVHPELRCHELPPGGGPWRIGRSPNCEIPLEDHAASREHAEVCRKGPLLLLRDLGSTNGTFLNTARVTQAPIQQGSILRIGDWVGILCATSAPDLANQFGEVSSGFH